MNTSEYYITSLLLGLAVALIHATFQLGVSVLTLLSGHSLSTKKAHNRLLRLNFSYVIGSFIAVSLTLTGLLSIVILLQENIDRQLFWSLAGIVSSLTGFLVLLSYYKKGKGTLLWIPRTIAEYLTIRAKKTRLGIEASALGIMTIIAELPFAFATLFIAALVINGLPVDWRIGLIASYAIVVCLPLVILTAMLGSGHKLSTVQRWREQNKTFLQCSAGIGLIVTSLYLTVFYLMKETRL